MRKITCIIALAILAGASFSTAAAKKKVVRKEAPLPVCQMSEADTLSYTAGQMVTRGLMEYVVEQLKVDTAYMATFVESLQKTLFIEETPEYRAKAAGERVGGMVKENMQMQISKRLEECHLPFNVEVFKRGFLDAVRRDTSLFTVDAAAAYHDKRVREAQEKKAAAAKAEGKAWLEENAKKPGIVTLPSGLQYKVIRQGNGAVAEGSEKVTVKYEGRLTDGTVFDSSYKRNPQTTSFSPAGVIKGWTEALYLMPEGSEWELYIPEHLGYGERQAGKIPPYSTLIFKIELVKVEKKTEGK